MSEELLSLDESLSLEEESSLRFGWCESSSVNAYGSVGFGEREKGRKERKKKAPPQTSTKD